MTAGAVSANATTPTVRSNTRLLWWRPTWPRLSWWLEALIIVAGYVAYEVLRYFSPGAISTSMANAHGLIRFEQWLHINIEIHVNRWLAPHKTLSMVSAYYYSTMHFIVTPIALAVLWWKRPRIYPWLRSALILLSFTALIVYWRYPVAPPRFAMTGAVDVLDRGNVFGIGNPHGVSGLIDQYAAMPSLHIGWALWVAFAVVTSLRSRWRYLAWLYPLLTTIVVISTANHYVLDGVAAVLLLGLCLLITRPVGQRGLSAVDRNWPDTESKPALSVRSKSADHPKSATTIWLPDATPESTDTDAHEQLDADLAVSDGFD